VKRSTANWRRSDLDVGGQIYTIVIVHRVSNSDVLMLM